jgi:hypothetical protein
MAIKLMISVFLLRLYFFMATRHEIATDHVFDNIPDPTRFGSGGVGMATPCERHFLEFQRPVK